MTATILANRGINTFAQAMDFFNPSLETLPSPFLLSGIDAAAERIQAALKKSEKILVIGDYDVDGVTGTAVMVQFLRLAGGDVIYHLPHRFKEGYGFYPIHVNQLALSQGVKVIITVDCGMGSHAAVEAANRFGIDVIITDHHKQGKSNPKAFAIVNPKCDGVGNGLQDLAGVGVAFYLVIALRSALRQSGWWRYRPEPNLKSLCDLVALGTVADIVPLMGANRILTKAGLDQINLAIRPGIQALIDASGIKQRPISAGDLAFRMAPRINAAGRMAHAGLAFDLLCAGNSDEAKRSAETLNVLNQRRQQIENQLFEEIVNKLDTQPDLLERKTIVLAGVDWHTGVLGIVAAKLVVRYYRPVILISVHEDIGKGSGRSIPGVDLYAAISRCSELLDVFGGHRLAAGLTLRTDRIDDLRSAFEKTVSELLPQKEFQPAIAIDSEIRFEHITTDLLDEIDRLEPFGTDNPAPIFMAKDVRVLSAAIVGQRHRRMTLCQADRSDRSLTAIQFNLSDDTPRPNYFNKLAFRLQWNRYRGSKEIQLVIEAF
jgi:single-stranded-DNA-specific exonuclease